jgi:DNA-binding CsgD family transcriptional regulator
MCAGWRVLELRTRSDDTTAPSYLISGGRPLSPLDGECPGPVGTQRAGEQAPGVPTHGIGWLPFGLQEGAAVRTGSSPGEGDVPPTEEAPKTAVAATRTTAASRRAGVQIEKFIVVPFSERRRRVQRVRSQRRARSTAEAIRRSSYPRLGRRGEKDSSFSQGLEGLSSKDRNPGGAMSRSSLSSTDVSTLRDILELAQPSPHVPSTTAVFEILRRLERLLGSDGVAFHAMDSRDFSYQHMQEVDAGEELLLFRSDLSSPGVADDGVAEEGFTVLRDHWWASPCSLIERTGTPVVTSIRSWYGERRWSEHPVHVEYLGCVDEVIFGYSLGAARSLRILAPRESGSVFGERELTLCRLLLPHLRDVLTAAVAPADVQGAALTERQTEILHLIEIGMSNQQVGVALGISSTTVRTHLEHVFERLGVTTRTAAVAAAFGPTRDGRAAPAMSGAR